MVGIAIAIPLPLKLRTAEIFLRSTAIGVLVKKLSSDPPVVEGSAETICLSPFLGWICGKIPSKNKLGGLIPWYKEV